MNPEHCILVAGDFCLDVAGLPQPPGKLTEQDDNWRQTGETRTHYLLGGAMLLTQFLRAAVAALDAGGRVEVRGSVPCLPAALACPPEAVGTPLAEANFLRIAERLSRDEIVHSLLRLDHFPHDAGSKDRAAIRVETTHGFSGPRDGEPSLAVRPPADDRCPARFILLDDTGNRFRRTEAHWPAVLHSAGQPATVIYKLHRPLPVPGAPANPLWETVAQNFPQSRIGIVHLDDLRAAGFAISQGLSWERTALDLAWHLENAPALAALRTSPHLIVRIGLDGALYRAAGPDGKLSRLSLVYDPAGIEGAFADSLPGQMIGYGSVFAAAFTAALAATAEAGTGEMVIAPDAVLGAIAAGLGAARGLGRSGFVERENVIAYPGVEIFADTKAASCFCAHDVPVIPGAIEPDRAYWRLLDTVFAKRNALLHVAVENVALGRKTFATAEQEDAAKLLRQVPVAGFGALRTHDRCEIENYRALHTLLRDYLAHPAPARPLSFAVFGPPGAGKSFGVKEVASSLKNRRGCRDIETHTFNLSLYQTPDELAAAFHLVRDSSLRGKVPLVFFDEFDTSLGAQPLGWLRYFLAPMQDGSFLDRGAPHPIGPAIFVFAGGTCATFAEFAGHGHRNPADFKTVKGPDFLSRLRATLDIPSLNFLTARAPAPDPAKPDGPCLQPPDTFDPYGPTAAFPCEGAILLRRAAILAFNLPKKAPSLVRSDGSLDVDPAVLRVLLRLPHFVHGNRSFEALLEMSHLAGAAKFTPSRLPAPIQIGLHANASHLGQLIGSELPFPPDDRELIARSIHESYRKQKRSDPKHDPTDRALKAWKALPDDLKESNLGQADNIADKLRRVGLWFRKIPILPKQRPSARGHLLDGATLEELARAEHDRWVAQKRSQGWTAGPDTTAASKIDPLLLHNCLVPWERLSKKQQELDFVPVRAIPAHLAAAGYEVVKA